MTKLSSREAAALTRLIRSDTSRDSIQVMAFNSQSRDPLAHVKHGRQCVEWEKRHIMIRCFKVAIHLFAAKSPLDNSPHHNEPIPLGYVYLNGRMERAVSAKKNMHRNDRPSWSFHFLTSAPPP